LNQDSRIQCTLNGESGEGFDVPIEEILLEGLADIVLYIG